MLPSGDMYEANGVYADYLAACRRYDTDEPPSYCRKNHEQWADTLPCPVLRLDGTDTIAENAARIVEYFRQAPSNWL
ncbi:MAG: hypothetical protein FWF44_05985 [Defluviitaleaceae bacterium]|nr:hypothetical protein [Defluviitaleaceae bacterium]